MKLNKRGWGYGTMILLMTILCLFLIVAIYYIYRLYNNVEIKQHLNITEISSL